LLNRIAAREAAVVIEDLHKAFGNNEVLRGIDLSVAAGSTVCIIGPSGGGKSTFLRCINALETPDKGKIRVGGEAVHPANRRWPLNRGTERRICAIRSQIGMVFQHFNLWSHMTVLGNVIEGLIQVKKLPRGEAAVIGEALLARVGLKEKMAQRPASLSGGQKQRVAIARALAMSPKLILMDEPTSALDPELTGEVLDTIRDLAKDGTTMIVVTHELAFAREISDRIVFMDRGRVIEDAPPSLFFLSPRTERVQEFLSRMSSAYSRGRQNAVSA
jgi:ABC-type polar amino acid transport system ATPase subunit